MGFSIHESTIREGLSDAIWPGRFQVLNKHPLLVIDGAHNEDAAKKLRKTLEMGFTNRKIIYIIGVLADKEYGKMLLHMLPLAEKVYTITPDNPRALPGELLCKEAEKHHDHVQFASNPDKAMKLAWKDVRESTEDTMVLAFGSLSYLGAMKQAMEQTVAEKIQS